MLDKSFTRTMLRIMPRCSLGVKAGGTRGLRDFGSHFSASKSQFRYGLQVVAFKIVVRIDYRWAQLVASAVF